MLASSLPRSQAGLSGRDVLVGCLTGNDPKSLSGALRLVQSVRWLGGELAEARVRVCVVDWLGQGPRRDLERYGAEVRIVPRGRVDGKRRIFPEDWESDREMTLLLDPDALVVQDPLPWMRQGPFHGEGSGLILVPSSVAETPVELDFQLDPAHPPPEGIFAVDPAILRYGDRVDPEGYLLHTQYPFAQVRIEAFNRRLRQEREGGPRPARPAGESPAAPATQVAALGMHRSGTSALTSLLRLMGLWAGEEGDFPPADDHNQAGYWEHRGVWSIDEAILQTLGASWAGVVDLDLSRLGDRLRGLFRERAREVIGSLDRHGPWVVKDPRLCLLFPFWREILERPFCVLIYREPLPVARSLAARDGFPIPHGIALWELYTRESLASTRGLPRVLISHRELMADPAATLRRLHHSLTRHRPELARLQVPTAEEIRAVLDPSLLHHPHDPEAERSYLNPPQLALLDALAGGSALELDPVPPLSAGARELLAAYRDQQAEMRALRDGLTTRTRVVESLRQAQEGLVAAHQSARAKDVADLHRAHVWLDELDALVSAILESRSWKIGRAVTAAIGRLRGGSRTSAPERRDRLMAEVRRWRKDNAGD